MYEIRKQLHDERINKEHIQGNLYRTKPCPFFLSTRFFPAIVSSLVSKSNDFIQMHPVFIVSLILQEKTEHIV